MTRGVRDWKRGGGGGDHGAPSERDEQRAGGKTSQHPSLLS